MYLRRVTCVGGRAVTKLIDDGLTERAFHCNRSLKSLYSDDSSSANIVPYAKRIESLYHAVRVDFGE